MAEIFLRPYRPSDFSALLGLFYETVHTVCQKDYMPEQLEAWTGGVDLETWARTFQEHYTLVAETGGKIAGFGDIDRDGYLDRLYIHKDFQRMGIAAALCEQLEAAVLAPKITTHASITAKGFFEKRGYQVAKEQQVERRGILLTNYKMELRKEKHL